MAWELQIRNRGFFSHEVKASYDNQNSDQFRKGFIWNRAGSGDCRQLNFWARRKNRNGTIAVNTEARDIVQLIVDGQPAFYGTILELPHPRSMGVGQLQTPNNEGLEKFEIVGMRQRIKEVITDTQAFKSRMDVAEFVRRYAQVFLPPEITYDEPSIPLTGSFLEKTYYPLYPLDQVFDALAQSAIGNIVWGVDATGTFFFRDIDDDPTLVISNPAGGVYWIPIKASEVVTDVYLVAVTENSFPAEAELFSMWDRITSGGTSTFSPYEAGIAFFRHTDAAHAEEGYFSTLSRLAPGLVEPAIALKDDGYFYYDTISSSNITGLANINDDDTTTFASNPSPTEDSNIIINTTGAIPNKPSVQKAEDIVGFRIMYEFDDVENNAHLEVNCKYKGQLGVSSFTVESQAEFRLRETNGEPVTHDFIFLPSNEFGISIRPDEVTFEINVHHPSVLSTNYVVQIYEFTPLVINRKIAENTAKSLIKLPTQEPAEVHVDSIIEPSSKVRVENIPGDDLEGNVVEYEYNMIVGKNQALTTIKIEDNNIDQQVRLTQMMAKNLDERVVNTIRNFQRKSR